MCAGGPPWSISIQSARLTVDQVRRCEMQMVFIVTNVPIWRAMCCLRTLFSKRRIKIPAGKDRYQIILATPEWWGLRHGADWPIPGLLGCTQRRCLHVPYQIRCLLRHLWFASGLLLLRLPLPVLLLR